MCGLRNCCTICLNTNQNVVNISENDANNVQIISKLKLCVPDVAWYPEYFICSDCLSQLDIVCSFREQCLCSQRIRESQNHDLVKDENHLTSKSIDHSNILNKEISNDNDICTIKKEFDNSLETQISDGEDFDTHDTNLESEVYIDNSETCPNLEDTKEDVKLDHSTIRNSRKKQFQCRNCDKKYAASSTLKKHLKICIKSSMELIEDTDSLKIGEHEFSSNVALTDSRVPKTESPPSNTCGICGNTFGNKYLLKRHLKNVHTTEKKYACEQCSRKFASPVYLNAHMRYHSRERAYICAFCGKGFITASDLYHHEKIHTNKRSYKCKQCAKAFNTSSDLHKHRICVHLDRCLWKYECSYCQRRFPLKTNLDTHIKIHTGEKNYMCNICDRRCINKSVLMRHITTHTNVQAFKCNVCLQSYKYKKSLELHMSKLHGVGEAPVREKKFICHICPKSYYVNSKLQKHLRTHSGLKPFKCPSCQKGFVDKAYVKQHLKTAHGIIQQTIE